MLLIFKVLGIRKLGDYILAFVAMTQGTLVCFKSKLNAHTPPKQPPKVTIGI